MTSDFLFISRTKLLNMCAQVRSRKGEEVFSYILVLASPLSRILWDRSSNSINQIYISFWPKIFVVVYLPNKTAGKLTESTHLLILSSIPSQLVRMKISGSKLNTRTGRWAGERGDLGRECLLIIEATRRVFLCVRLQSSYRPHVYFQIFILTRD